MNTTREWQINCSNGVFDDDRGGRWPADRRLLRDHYRAVFNGESKLDEGLVRKLLGAGMPSSQWIGTLEDYLALATISGISADMRRILSEGARVAHQRADKNVRLRNAERDRRSRESAA